LAWATENMDTQEAWVHSYYLKPNDMNIRMSTTGSAIVRIEYIGKMDAQPAPSIDQYDKYAGKATMPARYR